MDDDQQVKRLTTDEIALMREIVAWRKANGVSFFQWRPRVAFGPFSEWRVRRDGRTLNVSYEYADGGRIIATPNYHGGGYPEIAFVPQSVTDAVDILAARGFLPRRFSTAYRAGWDAMGLAMARPLGGDGQRAAGDLVPAVPKAW